MIFFPLTKLPIVPNSSYLKMVGAKCFLSSVPTCQLLGFFSSNSTSSYPGNRNLTISASGANAGYLQYNSNDIWAADCSYYQDNATIWFVYNTLKYLQSVISNLQCGAAQPHVYPKNINSLCILIPTEELIHKYNDFVKPYYDEIKVLNKHNQLLTQQRDMLLPRLMRGKLEV